MRTPAGPVASTSCWATRRGRRLQLQEKEFFASRAPEIADAPNAAKRKRMIDGAGDTRTPDSSPSIRPPCDGRTAQVTSSAISGRYPLTARGDINTYSIFAESMRGLVGPRGRVGCIVPTGIATDATTQFFFGDLVEIASRWSRSFRSRTKR